MNGLDILEITFPSLLQLVQRENWSSAYETLRCASPQESNKLDPKSKLILHNWLASFKFLAGDVGGCRKEIEAVLTIDPLDISAKVKRSLIFIENDHKEQALSNLQEIEGFARNDPSFFYYRGELMALLGNIHMALTDFEHCIELDNSFHMALARKARCLIILGSTENAIAELKKFLSSNPKNVTIMHSLAEAVALEGNVAECESILSSLENIDPLYPYTHLTRALISMNKPNPDLHQAEENLLKALEVDSGFQEARLQFASVLCHQQKLDDARRIFDEAIMHSKTDQQRSSLMALKIATLAQTQACLEHPKLKAKVIERMVYRLFIKCFLFHSKCLYGVILW